VTYHSGAIVVPFGKYKGQPVEVMLADLSYCEWALDQPWFPKRFGNLYNLIKPRNAAPAPTTHPRDEIVAYARSVNLKPPILTPDELRTSACEAFNRWQIDKDVSWPEATTSDPPAFLDYISVHYLRYNALNYQPAINHVRGRVGAQQAREIIDERTYTAISAAYPFLSDACALALPESEGGYATPEPFVFAQPLWTLRLTTTPKPTSTDEDFMGIDTAHPSFTIEGGPSGDAVLNCPRCGYMYLSCDHDTYIYDEDDVAIRFSCEGCSVDGNQNDIIELILKFHKGRTFIEWRFTPRLTRE
jgi:hypothetical protein